MHVRELGETREQLRGQLERLRELRGVVEFASKT
jgi:hypothetical protein